MRTIGIEYPAPNRMHFCELGDPGELSPSQILIRTEFSGITNGTERHAMLGEFNWKHFPGRHGSSILRPVRRCGCRPSVRTGRM